MFKKTEGTHFIILLVYVDDVLLASNNLQLIQTTKVFLDNAFKIKDLGPAKYFLGLELARSSARINLSQHKYTIDLLQDIGFLLSKPVATPMASDLRLSSSGDFIADPSSFRCLIGKLLYLTTTRPDISFAVQQLSQFMTSPTTSHLQAAHRVLRYLKQSPGQGLFFRRNSPLKICAFSDSDWGTCPDSRKSITGYCIFLGSSLIS
ncbi:hypothetical protein K2173_008330 [Erythroxylum novogranatense]|uniref:Reverse transcriptase Ty1/copia-type domain-containing protein n=1 Tax=Erythroxylum novogranatense TaxID=1862640 RepID=A0AAV8U3J2_9ROSI|nr:hypothetical protein K2173_008330 [Erythroxylum novogranatense]